MSRETKSKQPGLFDAEFRLRKLDGIGDPLQKLSRGINWERFRPLLDKGFAKDDPVKGPGGRPPYDNVLRFKVLVLQSLYNLSDDAIEFQLNDRRTFQRFIDLDDKDAVPDAKTIWNWRETLTQKGTMEKLFNKFWKVLEEGGIKANSGSIIDATFVDAPRQRNSRDENDEIKNGRIPEDWQRPEQEDKLRQKDVDARWAKKNDETHYGYKNHVKVDQKTKLIRKSVVTDASVHDSQALSDLLDRSDKGKTVYADSAYSGEEQIGEIRKLKAIPRVCEKGYRNRALTKTQQKRNKGLSRTRARIEHVFGFMTMSMGGLHIRSIGILRATAQIVLKNLAYNMRRYCVLASI
jgi:transposase, IS5 family